MNLTAGQEHAILKFEVALQRFWREGLRLVVVDSELYAYPVESNGVVVHRGNKVRLDDYTVFDGVGTDLGLEPA